MTPTLKQQPNSNTKEDLFKTMDLQVKLELQERVQTIKEMTLWTNEEKKDLLMTYSKFMVHPN